MTQDRRRLHSGGDGLVVKNLVKHFVVGKGRLRSGRIVHAVDDVNLTVAPGETLGIVGESGCGKSTLARVVAGLYAATSGSVSVGGEPVSASRTGGRASPIQMVFQDPRGSLDPRLAVGKSVVEPLSRARRRTSQAEIAHLLSLVGLPEQLMNRYPHELSGGQLQRICIARAMIADPPLIVHDESVSALDVSLQAQIVNLLLELQEETAVSYLFISHDMAIVEIVSHRVAVMYLGQVVEIGPAASIGEFPLHPYTVALRSAVLEPDPSYERDRRGLVLAGDIPSALDPPSGCRFHPRCPLAEDICTTEVPALKDRGLGHPVACHFPGELKFVSETGEVSVSRLNQGERPPKAPRS